MSSLFAAARACLDAAAPEDKLARTFAAVAAFQCGEESGSRATYR